MARESAGPFFLTQTQRPSTALRNDEKLRNCGSLSSRVDQGGGAADPFEVLVVVHAHHLAASHADQGHHGDHAPAFWPDVHNAHLGLRSAMRGLDDRSK